MRLLFAISGGSFCAVLSIVFAVARRIRRSRARAAKASQRRFSLHAEEFFEAGEFRTPRPLRLEQEIFKQKPRRPLSEITFPAQPKATQNPALNQAAPATKRPHSSEPIPIRPSASFATLFGETVRINQLNSSPAVSAASGPAAGTIHSKPSNDPAPNRVTSQRMPPRSESSSTLRRGIGLSSGGKDAGDAFNHPLRSSGTQGPVPARRADR